MPQPGGERKFRSGGGGKNHISVNFGQAERAIQRRQVEAFAKVIELFSIPDSLALFNVLRDMRAVLSD